MHPALEDADLGVEPPHKPERGFGVTLAVRGDALAKTIDRLRELLVRWEALPPEARAPAP